MGFGFEGREQQADRDDEGKARQRAGGGGLLGARGGKRLRDVVWARVTCPLEEHDLEAVGRRVRVRVRVRSRGRDRGNLSYPIPHLEAVGHVREGEQRGGRALAHGEEEAADPQHGEAVAEGDGQVAVEHARQGRSHAAGDDLEPHGPAHGGARGQRAVGDPGEQRELERVRVRVRVRVRLRVRVRVRVRP